MVKKLCLTLLKQIKNKSFQNSNLYKKKSWGQKIYPLLKFNLIIVLKVRTIGIHIFDLKRKQAIDDALALQFIGKVSKSLNFMGATLW